MSDTESAEPPRRRRTARSKSRSAGTPPEGVPRPSAEEDARDDQNAPIIEKSDDAADPDRDTEADRNRGVIQAPSDEGGRDDGSEDGTIEETLPDEGNDDASDQGAERGESTAEENGRHLSLVRVARRAAEQVAALTGRQPESVISIEPRDGDWCVGVEVVETRRIPDSADILAIYEVLVRSSGDLISYRRIRRYTRGQVDRPRW
jgi:hypothetical protein